MGTTWQRGVLAGWHTAVPIAGAAAAALLLSTATAAGQPRASAVSPPASLAGQSTQVVIDSVVSASLGRGASTGTLRFDVRNTGSTTATGIETRFELTDGIEFVAAGSSPGCRAPNTVAQCDIASLGPGATSRVSVGLRVTDVAVPLGTRRAGVLLAPRVDGADPGAGELSETGPDGARILDTLPGNVSRGSVTSWTWTSEFRPLFTSARVCAVGLAGSASLTFAGGAGGPAQTTTVTGTGGTVVSSPLATTIGAVQGFTLAATATGWTSLGLIGPGETCTTAAAGAIGVNGRWRYRLPIDLTVGAAATTRLDGAVWGRRAGQPVASTRVVNAGPDTATVEVTFDGASRTPGMQGCVGAAGSTTVMCSVAPLAADGSTVVTIQRAAESGLGRFSIRSVDGSTTASAELPAR